MEEYVLSLTNLRVAGFAGMSKKRAKGHKNGRIMLLRVPGQQLQYIYRKNLPNCVR